MTDAAAGERLAPADVLVLPRRSQAWRSHHGFLLLAVVSVLGAAVWIAEGDALAGPLLVVAMAVGGWLAFVLVFELDEGSYRLRIDDVGISSMRRGAVLETTPWESMTYVEFDSGARLTNWQRFGVGVLGSVACHDDRPYDRWNPGDVGAYVELPVFGRRALRQINDAVRAACDAHGVEYRSSWWITWRAGFRPSNWRRPGARST